MNIQRMCCCALQSHIREQDVQSLLRHPENHLRNIASTYKERVQGQNIYDIREFFHDSQIPFRWSGCKYSHMVCCGSCTRTCDCRCPQDVVTRAYILCANVFNAPDEPKKQRRLAQSSTTVQMLYVELTSEIPKYFMVAEMVNELIVTGAVGPVEGEIYEKQFNPYKYDYAPIIEYEQVPGEFGKMRKKTDVETGDVAIMHWPLSGLCPFCLPVGLTNRRRCKRPRTYY